MLLRKKIVKNISKLSLSFFVALVFAFSADFAHASPLNSCGEIAVSGTYTLSSDLGSVGTNCVTVTTSGVTIDGASTYSVLGNISGNRTNYTLTNVVSTGDLSIFYYNNAAADGNWANKANWWLDSAYTLTANRSGVTVPSTQDEVVINGNVSQISTGVASVKSARFINNATWNVGGSTITDGLVWTKTDNTIPSASDTSSTNGRLPLGNAGRGDTVYAYSVSDATIKDGSTYKRWYMGQDATGSRIFYATSANGLVWTKYDNTVPAASDTTSTNGRIPFGTAGKGDSAGVANHVVIKDGSTYKMWYGGYNGTNWRIFYATSPDGLTWTKYNNTIPAVSNTTSTDGRIPLGTDGAGDDYGTYLGSVVKEGNTYKMWYRGYDSVNVRVFHATSPDGLTWTKYDNTIPSASDSVSTNGRLALGSSGKGDDTHAQIPVIYKDGAMYKMYYAGYNLSSSSYSTYLATSPDGLTWTKYNNVIPSISDTVSTDGRIPKGSTAGRGDLTGVIPSGIVLDSNLFKMWYSGYNNTNWRGFYATAPNSYRALNLSVGSTGTVNFEGNSKFGKGTISTSDSNAVSAVNFTGSSIATEASVRATTVNINTSTSTAGVFEILNNSAVVNINNISSSSTVNIVGSNIELNLNNSSILSNAVGNSVTLNINDSARVNSIGLTGSSTIKFNTNYYHGTDAPTDGVLEINYGGLSGIIHSDLTLLDSEDNEIEEISFGGGAVNSSKGISIPVSFHDSSTNTGTINANVTVNSPVTRPIGGTITGTITYTGYNAGFYYNNASTDSNWANNANWWADSNFSTPATTALSYDDVYVSGNVHRTTVASTDQALSLNGSGYASRANVAYGTVYSIDFWAKTSMALSGMNGHILQGSTGSTVGRVAFGVANSQPAMFMNSPDSLSFMPWAHAKISDSKWHHWTIVRNNGCQTTYKDGAIINYECRTNTYGASFSHIGADTAGNNRFNGQLNQMVIWNKALSVAEVAARYNLGLGSNLSSYTNVVAEYRFDGNYNDSSPNGYHLSAAGSGNSFVTGSLTQINTNRIQAQNYTMNSGTISAEIDSTAQNLFYGTSTLSGVVFGDAVFYEDGPSMTAAAIVTSATPKTNGGLSFNANMNSYATAPRIAGTSNFTMSTWVRMPTMTANHYGVAHTKAIFGLPFYAGGFSCKLNTAPYYFGFNAETHLQNPSFVFGVGTDVNNNPNKKISVSASSIPLNTWAHLTGTYNGSIMRFYINGVEAGTIAQSGNVPGGGGDQLIQFGNFNCTGDANRPGEANFVGELRDVAIWTGAVLTASQVSDLYKKAPDQIGVTPTAFWKMYGGSGSTAVNSINGGQNATLYSMTWNGSTPAPAVYSDDASITRIYTASATTTKNFTLNSGRWIVEADGNGVNVNMTGATYSVSTTTYQSNKNVFRAKNGATFTENPSINGGAPVVPKVILSSPAAGTILRWKPVVDWEDAELCQYKWGANGTYTNVSCASGGSDIPKPTAFATTTMYIKGSYDDTSYSETSVTFLYDNVSPAPADCTIPMDEPTRQYYYLESDVSGDCTATTNVTLKGNADSNSPGYTLTGKVIANATSTTNGFNLNLQNITVTDEITSNANGSGNRGGNITATNSTLANVVTNGGAISVTNATTSLLASNANSGGILGGNITINQSVTTDVYANGGDINVTESEVDLLDSTSATGGIAGGSITLTDSNVANINTNGGTISVTNSVTSQLASNPNSGGIMGGDITVEVSTTTLIYANGGDITVTDSNVGLIDTMSPTAGVAGGAVIITDSTTENITTNGGTISVTNSVTSQLASNSNSGGILGGNITVEVSTTTAIYANGGDITVSTSSVGLLDSTSATDGVAGGDITITNPISTIPSITTNGGDITLNNVVVIGAITANGNTGGVSAGTINIEFSTTTAIYANGGTHSSGNGGHGATITIATSTTGLIEASGADSTGDGGDGGIITITNSLGTNATSTPITANGGDSTSCGNGGDSGIVTIVDTTYGTITADPGVGFNGGCPSDTKASGIRNIVTTVGQGHSSIPRPAAPTQGNSGAIGGGINPLFRNGLNGLDFTPIQKFNLFGDGSGGGFKPIDAGTTRLPKVFTDLNRLNDFLLDEMPVDILPSLELFVFDEVTEDLANLFPNSSNLLAAVGVERSQELAGLFRSPKLLSDISNPEKYGLFKVYSGDVVVNTYVAYEEAIENLAQLIKANPSQIIHIGTYAKGKITDESKVPYIIYQGQKKLMTPTFDGYYATSVIAPNLEGRYLIETSSDVQILLDVLPQNQSNEQSKPWGVFHKLWKLFH